MHLTFRNVNDAFRGIVQGFHDGSIPTEKRPYSNPNGSGIRIQVPEPVMITYTHPKERVLFNQARDCNFAFHLYEALWMLAGRNDVAPLAYYNSKVGGYSDDGETFNGAYGYRWRTNYTTTKEPMDASTLRELGQPSGYVEGYKNVDQLTLLIDHLRRRPESSRTVLAMWNVEDDLLKIDSSKDVCCNLDVVFSIREEYKHWDKVTMPDGTKPLAGLHPTYLDMTVFNRSNDLIWGALGANYVHFTVLQEYVAAHLDVEVGRYTQATTNLHVYDWNWKPEEWLAVDVSKGVYDPYCNWTLMPLVKDPATFDEELPLFVEWVRRRNETFADPDRRWDEPFLDTVARPMFLAFCAHKQKQPTALAWAAQIAADDWRVAATNWLKKRVK